MAQGSKLGPEYLAAMKWTPDDRGMSQGSGAGAPPPPPTPPPPPNPAQAGVVQTANGSSDPGLTGHLLEAWKKTVDVQQHFNQIEMDIRKTAVTVIVAVIGAAGFAANSGMQMVLLGFTINVAFLIIVAGMVALGAFFWMDFFQYHRLLLGAVEHGKDLEKALSVRSIPVSLTATVGKFSPIFIRGRKFRSDDKIKLFYQLILGVLLLFALGALFGSSATKGTPSPTTPATIEIVPKADFKADVRILSVPSALASPPPNVAPNPIVAPPSATTLPTPSLPPPPQTQTGQAAPQSSE